MSDLISKEYMKKLGGTCIAARGTDGDLYPIAALDELPLAQPKIIRCKDCKFYRPYAGTIDGHCYKAEWYTRYQYADDYCSRAELRGDKDE